MYRDEAGPSPIGFLSTAQTGHLPVENRVMNVMRHTRSASAVFLVGFVLVAAACGADEVVDPPDTPDPPDSASVFDPVVVADQLEEVVNAVAVTSPYMAALRLIRDAIPSLTNAGALGAPQGPARPDATVAVPPELRAKTFVWDADQEQYVEDPDAAGAPSNGARFVYYAVDATTLMPTLPLDAQGHVDLIDISVTPSVILNIRIVEAGTTPIVRGDYTTNRTISGQAVQDWEVDGYIVGSERLDFELPEHRTGTFITLNYDFTRGEGRALADLHADIDGTGSISVTFMRDGDVTVYVIDFIDSGASATGTVSFNGTVVYNIAGDFNLVNYTDVEGATPPTTIRQALRRIGRAQENLINLGLNVLFPARPFL